MAKKEPASRTKKKKVPEEPNKWERCFFYKDGYCSIMKDMATKITLSKKCVPIKMCENGLNISRLGSSLRTKDTPTLQEDMLRTIGIGPFANYF